MEVSIYVVIVSCPDIYENLSKIDQIAIKYDRIDKTNREWTFNAEGIRGEGKKRTLDFFTEILELEFVKSATIIPVRS